MTIKLQTHQDGHLTLQENLSIKEQTHYYPLAELTECILNSSNRAVVTLVDILQDCKSTNLSYNSCKQSFCFFGIISY